MLFDQRNCGRSTPHASISEIDLRHNLTSNLVQDVERLRSYLHIERWLILGGSWGSTLALAYAETHPQSVTEIILFGVTTGRHREFDWLFRGGVSVFFPEEWNRLLNWLPTEERDSDTVAAYKRWLHHPDVAVCHEAAFEWCTWESATLEWPPSTGLAERFHDPLYRLAFARIVTHYASHNAWLEDETLLRNSQKLADIPGVLINGRFDFQSPISNAWHLKRVWDLADLRVVPNSGHRADEHISEELVRATSRFAHNL